MELLCHSFWWFYVVKHVDLNTKKGKFQLFNYMQNIGHLKRGGAKKGDRQ